MRILCYAQHLSGVGHFVRMHTLARGLCRKHEVYLVDGGRPVPRSGDAGEIELLPLPALFRSAGRLAAVETGAPVATVLAARARALAAAVEGIRPDVVLVDHYPFSKWELEGEIAGAIDTARRANPAVRVLCSLRDIAPQTRQERVPQTRYEERVVALLRARFDGILVHADPAFSLLADHFGRGADLPVPVHYTGFVVEGTAPAGRSSLAGTYAVLSCGGSAGGLPFLLAAIAAFRRGSTLGRPSTRGSGGTSASMPLVVFPSPFLGDADAEALRIATQDGPFRVCRFSPDFAGWLPGSALSISRAGYNTIVQLLQSRVRSVLAPDPEMSDQGPRARRLAELGLATVVEGNPCDETAIAMAIQHALAGPRPRHQLNLDGVAGTQTFIEAHGRESGARCRSTRTSASRSTPV